MFILEICMIYTWSIQYVNCCDSIIVERTRLRIITGQPDLSWGTWGSYSRESTYSWPFGRNKLILLKNDPMDKSGWPVVIHSLVLSTISLVLGLPGTDINNVYITDKYTMYNEVSLTLQIWDVIIIFENNVYARYRFFWICCSKHIMFIYKHQFTIQVYT